jgi:L-alanine-DL-glutamate epimerase-like enolase superfamily enzyme
LRVCEWDDPSPRQHTVFENPPRPIDGFLHLPSEPGLGLRLDEGDSRSSRVPVA